jgi:hypothetical protein
MMPAHISASDFSMLGSVDVGCSGSGMVTAMAWKRQIILLLGVVLVIAAVMVVSVVPLLFIMDAATAFSFSSFSFLTLRHSEILRPLLLQCVQYLLFPLFPSQLFAFQLAAFAKYAMVSPPPM